MALDLNELSGPQRRIVRDAFLAAFTAQTLDQLLQDELDLQPLATLVPAASFEAMVFNLINLSKREGWTDRLIAAAERTSNNARVRGLRASLETAAIVDVAALEQRVTAVAPASGGLERLVRVDGGFADWGLWIEKMTDIGRRICRIQYPDNLKMAGGTGFLVARDLVLTNYHVIERHAQAQQDPADIACLFDFAVGSAAPVAVKLAAAPKWLVDWSPYSPHDPGDAGGVPDPDHLDYALLRLQRAIGEGNVAGQPRGWIQIDSGRARPAAKSILFIGQHPQLEPLKLAIGAVLEPNGNGTRLLYDTNTERGSSGSPGLDAGLHAVVLHHAGDPDYSRLLGRYNQGIPLDLIVQRMAARGVPKFWT
ncbi:trypsin-like peptidase domain-containing protein [Steroidobacter sp. S1-65]|uniref:Trypsin-like peptidase domain-containing protein n=1 Tax=Steroidobacter gossypii TaxID=2805490 RepID=A0ABS1WUK4_9GAMM|nr:effector-associated domain EAD1-containing protein [Steroidobacter gossypii]MBM0104659.1 trypsin-like peptidase domain-containing protein [Steroidobacter gossypii]